MDRQMANTGRLEKGAVPVGLLWPNHVRPIGWLRWQLECQTDMEAVSLQSPRIHVFTCEDRV